jgi:hypothetical protein
VLLGGGAKEGGEKEGEAKGTHRGR